MVERAEILVCTKDIADEFLDISSQRNLYEVWQAARGASGGAVPNRGDIDVLDLRDCMGHLLMLDVVDGGRDFLYRVHGTNVARAYGSDMTGKMISDLPSEMSLNLLDIYRDAVTEAMPCFARIKSPLISSVDVMDRLILPLRHGGENVAKLLVGCYPRRWREKPTGYI